ncbi:MAG TPA: monovalent cation/H+ antiporter complex subunit F [Alphaproteobacteria bacterium]|nr:monovalent cation/H+ antiporter complex subunit F [Alphaproteobacteria bacterium]
MTYNTAVIAAVTIAVIIVLAMALARAIIGPTVYDRVLAVNMIGTKTVVLIALVGYLDGRPDFLDIALLYALINFIGTIAVLKFLRYGDLGKASEEEGDI